MTFRSRYWNPVCVLVCIALAAFPATIVSAAPSLPPDAANLSLDDLERRNDAQERQNQEVRKRWADWQARMDSDFKRTMRLDASPEIVIEATSRFLSAYALDNPFSTEDDRLREIAQRRKHAAQGGSVDVELDVSELSYVRAPSAIYPSLSMRLRETGEVTVEVVVHSDGTVLSATIRRSSGYPRLDSAAKTAALSARFQPLRWTRNIGAVRTVIPFSFKLDS